MIDVLCMTQLYTSEEFTGISMVNYFLDLIRLVDAVQHGKFRWTVAVPSTNEFVKWDEASIVAGRDNVSVVPILPRDKFNRPKVKDGFAGQDFSWFSPEAFRYFASDAYLRHDVVLSQFYHAQPVIEMQALGHRNKQHHLTPKAAFPSLVNLLTETGADKTLARFHDRIGKACMTTSAAVSDATVVLSWQDRDWLQKTALEMLSPSERRRLRVERFLPTLDLNSLPMHVRPRDRAVFFHGGTFEAKRHLRFLANATLLAGGRLVLSTQWERSAVSVDFSTSSIELHTDVRRARYHELLASGDFLLCHVDYEGTGLGYMEAIASGMVPIVMDRPWIRERLPADYPFLCKSEQDFAAAMRYCVEHPVEAKARGECAVFHVRELYDPMKAGLDWAGFLTEMAQLRQERTLGMSKSSFIGRLALEVLQAEGRMSTKDLMQSIADGSKNTDVAWLHREFPYVRAVLQAFGLTETKEGWEWPANAR